MIADSQKENHEQKESNELFLIGVGASAGGLAPIYSLFENPAPPNASFIVIQHLPPDFKSNTANLLANHIKRPVKEIQNNMPIEPNTVYVMTQRKNIKIQGDRIFTSEDEGIYPNNAVDSLLMSIGEQKGNRCGAIILSGANSDGTKGAEAIREAGGFVIVQDPATAQFDVMPNSVINAGLSDAVIAPESLMNEVTKRMKQSLDIHQFMDTDKASLKEILDLIAAYTPLDFSDYKQSTIVRRISRRLGHHNFTSLTDYIKYLQENHTELEILSREFMISVTRFFRDAPAFDIIKEKTIPDLIENKKEESSLKVWIVGCATGEEAYSMAILICEHLKKINKKYEVKIFATDIDAKALAVASRGVYRKSIQEDVPEEILNTYFVKENNQYRIKEHIRSMLIFAQHDITKHPPYYKLDFISCRNVLIYLNPPLQKKVLSSLQFCLIIGGYLFLGPSENLGELKNLMEEQDKKWKIYKNLKAGQLAESKYITPKYTLNPHPSTSKIDTSKSESRSNIPDLISQLILNKLGYAGVTVDLDCKIIQTFGDFDKFLLPERFNFNLLEMLPKELSIATGISLRKSIKESIDSEIKGIVFEDKGQLRSVNVSITSVQSNVGVKLMLVLFNENSVNENEGASAEVFHTEIHSNQYIADLETEVKDLKEKVNEAHYQLDICYNNTQAYNEELIAGNEELQSTNEEVQSVNEELQTVNNQYQLKIKELAELNDDLNNYFRSAQNAQIYIDKDLIIRKFTPPAITQINIKENDIGRPITDLSTNIKFSTFIEDLKLSIKTSSIIEKEVQTLDKRWYQMMFMPYLRQQDNEINGAVITFNEITALKNSQRNLMKINEDHNTFIYSVSHDLNSPISNISGIIEALRAITSPEDKEKRELTDLLAISIDKLKATIVELSDITKIEKESSEEINESVDLRELIQEIEFSIRDMIKSSTKIYLDLQETSVNFPRKNLRSILLNLLTNAIKYRSPERDLEINIRTERKGNYINLYVEDNGIGISPTKKSKLFSKFERVHEEAGIKGSGIGLYLIKKIITNSEGKIKVESEEGKGSTFIVSFKIID